MGNNTEFGSRVPKIFISYAWTSPEYQETITKFAQRLMENGVEVIIDVWDLKPGHSMFAFMESMVTDQTIDKVLVICNKSYAEKAASYDGGVGTETQIIGPHIYNKVKQEKFIPVILEREENGKDHIPVHMDGRIYIDLDRNFEKGFEELLRLLYKQPLLRKPRLGSAPTYLFEEKKTRLKVDGVLSSIRDATIHRPGRIKGLCYDYKKSFIQDLEMYRVTELTEPYDDRVYSLIHDMVPLRNNYIEFIENLCSDQALFDTKIIIDFFESIYIFTGPIDTTGPIQFEHYRYFVHEIFLYTAIVLISRKMYKELNEICKNRYFIKYMDYGELIDGGYGLFYFYLHSLIETRNCRLSLNRVSVHADLIKDLSSSSGYSWDNLIEADCILFYINNIKRLKGDKLGFKANWYPVTSAYFQFSYPNLPLLQRLKTKDHFNEIKYLLGIEDIDDLERIRKLSAVEGRISRVPSLTDMLPSEIAVY
ncbi:TPA: SEFIR domain-containing protein [Bacillus paranthracis]